MIIESAIITIALGSSLLTGGAVGVLLGGRNAYNTISREQRQAIDTRRDLTAANKEIKGLVGVTEGLTGEVEELTRQRDEYKSIALTRDVKFPEAVPDIRVTQVWEKRRFMGHPSANLGALSSEISSLEEVHLRVKMSPRGGFKAIWKNKLGWDTSVPWTIEFTGPPERVISELQTWLHDDDYKHTIRDKYDRVEWADKDSPMIWIVSCDRVERRQDIKPPEIHVREVAVVEKVVVEKVVYRDSEGDIDPQMLAAVKEVEQMTLPRESTSEAGPIKRRKSKMSSAP